MQYTQKNRKGFALSIVLWIVAALLFGIATMALFSKDIIFLTKGVDAKLKSQLAAQDTLEALKFYVATADFDSISFKNNSLSDFKYKLPSTLVVDNRTYKIGDDIEINIQDVSALLNIMYAPPSLIASLATTSSQRQKRYVIADSIKDWKDADNVVSLNGAEASRYELKEDAKFKIRNSSAIQSVDEMRLIQGLDSLSEKSYKEFRKKFYYGPGATVNLALLDAKYLSLMLKINLSQAESLIQTRAKDFYKFTRLVMFGSNFDDDLMGFSLSRTLLIEIKARHKDATSKLKTIISFKKFRDKVYTTVSYELR